MQDARRGPLGLDGDTLAGCVQCGLCLPHCPTFRVSGEEARSPRGRIDAMRDVEWRGAPVGAGFAEAIDSCVGCRGCETACPSGVHFGELLEGTRHALAAGAGPSPVGPLQRWGLARLDRPRLLRAGALALAVAQRVGMGGVTRRRNLPLLPVRREPLRSTGDDVVLLTGCVMDAVQRDVHAAAVRVLTAAGFGVRVQPRPGCCGALAAHAGLSGLAARQVDALAAGLPAGVPVLVDSAGCGAAVLEAGRRPGAPAAVVSLSERAVDISTFLARELRRLPAPSPDAARPVVAVQDPCHLRHVQHAHECVHEVLARYVEVRALDDEGLCCGAGGSYSLRHPGEAAAIRERKLAAIGRTGAPVVASANPGCALHLAAGGATVLHPVQVIDRMCRTGSLAP